MTGNAAALEYLTRWLGVVIAFVGALAVNPEATAQVGRTFWTRVGTARRATRKFLARYIPWLRESATVPAVTGTANASFNAFGSVTARALVGWGPKATTARKIAMLDDRTREFDKEPGELQQKVVDVETRLRNELADAVASLRGEAVEIREAVDEVKRETVRLDASALPIIVLGVVLGGIAADAEEFQLWFWWLLLAAAVAFTIWRTTVIYRDWRAASRAATPS